MRSVATATVTDSNGNPVTTDTVTIATSGDALVGTVAAHGDGTYTATIIASTTADTETITATDGATGVAGTAALTEIAGPATTVSVSLSPSTLTADGSSRATATATVEDLNHNPVPGDPVAFSTDGGSTLAPSIATTDATGTASVQVTASRVIGSAEHLAARDTASSAAPSATGTVTLTLVAGPLDHLGLSPAAATIPARTLQAYTAEGFDAYGHDLGDVTSSTSFSIANGTCAGTGCSAATAGAHTVTGSNGSTTGIAVLTVVADTVTVTPHSHALTANGTSHTSVTARVTDAAGNPVSGVVVTFSSASHPIPAPATPVVLSPSTR